jgi:hypothetical protein
VSAHSDGSDYDRVTNCAQAGPPLGLPSVGSELLLLPVGNDDRASQRVTIIPSTSKVLAVTLKHELRADRALCYSASFFVTRVTACRASDRL